ncbi:MAG: hypothetical protein SOR61_03975 [Evtepia sp.]|uniref:hypothetical protein n=1 Tax=Evtepia sp. TaxID=2773933 RepID=UPI002A763C45|nr:hypothetical protein [Evtepia sp.]MDY3014342.1 hypothetical protein [Evtepia sp.]
MKKEGVIGFLLIALVIIVAVVFFRPKGLEAAMGDGFQLSRITKVEAALHPAEGGEVLTVQLQAGEEGFADLLTLLNQPSYAFTFSRPQETPTLPYLCVLSLFDQESDQVWEVTFQGGSLLSLGPTGQTRTHKSSDGQANQQAILDLLRNQAVPAENAA